MEIIGMVIRIGMVAATILLMIKTFNRQADE